MRGGGGAGGGGGASISFYSPLTSEELLHFVETASFFPNFFVLLVKNEAVIHN